MKKGIITLALLGLSVPPPSWPQSLPGLSPVQSVIDRQAERAQAQAIESAVRQAESVQERALDRAESQAQGVQERAVDRIQDQAERVRSEAADRAQDRVDQVQSQAAERAVERAGEAGLQAAERARGRVERVQSQATERARERVAEAIEGAAGQAPGNAGGVLAQQDAPPALPDRLSVPDQAGNAAFVEITLEPGVRAIEFEWVMLLDEGQRQRLDEEAPDLLGFLADTRPFGATGGQLLTFRVPPDLDAGEAILELVPEDLRDRIDRNHVYAMQNEEVPLAAPSPAPLLGPLRPVCETPVSVGVIDSAVEAEHPAFSAMGGRGSSLHRQDFLPAGSVRPSAHGTAVAALLAGEGGDLRPLLPGATLYSASVVYAQDDHHQGATVLHLLQALDWLIAQDDLRVINISLAGPDNRLLEQAVGIAAAKGKVVAAAVGNEGPHAPPRYPAAYEGVVGVTAVARDARVYRWAGQGPQVDFAALGVDVTTARAGGGFGPESGTSLATPVVSAFLACALAAGAPLDQALAGLREGVLDLGEPGPDAVYGQGLLHP